MEKLTRFERARVISARALQLALGAPPLVKPSVGATPYDIAREEFEMRSIPFVVLRRFPSGESKAIEIS